MLNADLLTTPEVQNFIEEAIRRKMDSLQVSSALSKKYSNEDRASIMDYLALVPKFREKFGLETAGKKSSAAVFLLCDKLALEQSTAQDIGRWKSYLWPLEGTVHDLCCGMGGDTFFIPTSLKVVGVDLDSDRIRMYRHNAQQFKHSGETLQEDACTVNKNLPPEQKANFFTIDPARRALEGENQRDLRNLTPTFEEVLELSKNYEGGMAKLPPGYPTDKIPADCEVLYIGGRTDCRELLVLFGTLAKNPGKVRAVMVDKNGEAIKAADGTSAEWEGTLTEIQSVANKDAEKDLPGCERAYRTATSDSDLPQGDLSAYLSEPVPLLVRSHLFGIVAKETNPDAHLISEGIAYASSQEPINSLGFANFKVLAKTEIATSAVRSMLKEFDIGKLTLKLRGVKVDPDEEIKRLKPKGKKTAILFYTRIAGEKTAILAERL